MPWLSHTRIDRSKGMRKELKGEPFVRSLQIRTRDAVVVELARGFGRSSVIGREGNRKGCSV